ncbi:MAG TPA: hypothetical protein VNX15_12045, partial [Gemmatimonadales bacterium]|nr:hypothetical protein [Gemmatimonadales bacterium]
MNTARTMGRRLGTPLAIGLLLLAPVGCNDWLNVATPDVIAPGGVQNSDGAIAAYAGAIGAFAFGNDGDNGGTEGQVLVSGVMSDEYFDAETFPTRIEYDSRNITETNTTLTSVFFNWSQARVTAEHAATALEQYAPAPASRVGEMFNLAGYTYIEFAENYCSGVPFDERDPSSGAVVNGVPITTKQILARAIQRFDTSLAKDTGATAAAVEQNRMARIGLARALVDDGDYVSAAAQVAGIPTNFAYNTVHSNANGREFNGVDWFNNQAPNGTARFSVADQEGVVGLNFRTAGDPRVVAPQIGKGFDNSSPLYVLAKYNVGTPGTSPVAVATGIEARLIEAEAAGGATMITDLNNLRADQANNGGFNLAALPDPGTASGRDSLLFRERAFWMFGTGHRLGDLRRLVRQYAHS